MGVVTGQTFWFVRFGAVKSLVSLVSFFLQVQQFFIDSCAYTKVVYNLSIHIISSQLVHFYLATFSSSSSFFFFFLVVITKTGRKKKKKKKKDVRNDSRRGSASQEGPPP